MDDRYVAMSAAQRAERLANQKARERAAEAPRLVGLFRYFSGNSEPGLEKTETHGIDAQGRIWNLRRGWTGGSIATPWNWHWALVAEPKFEGAL